MPNRLQHFIVGAVSTVVGCVVFGIALSSVSVTRVLAMILTTGWLILGALAWCDSLRERRKSNRFRTPRTCIYQVLPPHGYVRNRQYPLHHCKVSEKSPQSE